MSTDYLTRLKEAKILARELAAASDFYVTSTDEWLGLKDYLFSFAQEEDVSELVAALKRDPHAPVESWNGTELDAIVNLDRQLKSMGIDLIVTIHPYKEEVYAQKWFPVLKEEELLFPEIVPLALTLVESDVEVIYMLPRFLSEATKPGAPFLFDGTDDVHWTHPGVVVAARMIAERLSRYDFVSEAKSRLNLDLRNDDFGRVFVGSEVYKPDVDSPLLLIGDSFAGGAAPYYGLGPQIAKETGMPISLLWVSGGARAIPRTLAEMGWDYIHERRVIVWNIGSALFRPLHQTPIATVSLPKDPPIGPSDETSNEQMQIYALVEEVSQVPDPAISLYADAITVTTLRARNIEKGSCVAIGNCPNKLRGAQWVMRDRDLLDKAATLNVGDQLRVRVRPFRSYQEENPGIESVQRSDDTTDIELPLYWIDDFTVISRKQAPRAVKD
jgi:hypothetical protein